MYYHYQAVSSTGQILAGSAEAPSGRMLTERLEKQGYQVIELRVDWKANFSRGFSKRQLKRSVLVEFFANMKGILELGMNVTAAISTVKDTLDDRTLRQALDQIEDSINKGFSLHEAVDETGVFPGLAVASVAAAERANRLEEVFQELANHYRELDTLAKNAKKAATYPIIAIVVLSLVFTMLLVFVVPQLEAILPKERPLITDIVFGLSHIIEYVWWIPPATVVGIFIVARNLPPDLRARLSEFSYHVPLIGRLKLNLELSSVFMSLAMLNGGGIPLLESLRIATGATNSPYIRNKLAVCRELAAQGTSLTEGFRDKLFPPVVTRAVAHGEATGRFDKQFAGIANFLRDRAATQLQLLSNFVEPLLILVGGGMLMIMALSIFLPIYGNLSNFGK